MPDCGSAGMKMPGAFPLASARHEPSPLAMTLVAHRCRPLRPRSSRPCRPRSARSSCGQSRSGSLPARPYRSRSRRPTRPPRPRAWITGLPSEAERLASALRTVIRRPDRLALLLPGVDPLLADRQREVRVVDREAEPVLVWRTQLHARAAVARLGAPIIDVGATSRTHPAPAEASRGRQTFSSSRTSSPQSVSPTGYVPGS